MTEAMRTRPVILHPAMAETAHLLWRAHPVVGWQLWYIIGGYWFHVERESPMPSWGDIITTWEDTWAEPDNQGDQGDNQGE